MTLCGCVHWLQWHCGKLRLQRLSHILLLLCWKSGRGVVDRDTLGDMGRVHGWRLLHVLDGLLLVHWWSVLLLPCRVISILGRGWAHRLELGIWVVVGLHSSLE
jgi:hypothetical protein